MTVEENRSRAKTWYERNREYAIAYQKKRRSENREAYNEYHRKYYRANHTKLREQARIRYRKRMEAKANGNKD